MLDYVRRGDTVIAESISSFTRSTRDLLDLTELLSTKGGVVCLPKGEHRHHPDREIYAHRLWRCGGAGAGLHPPAAAGGDCNHQRTK